MDFKQYYSEDMVVGLTQELVRIESHADAPGREKNAGDFIERFCIENGLEYEAQTVEGERRNICVYLRGKNPGKTIVFNGHIDTVKAYEMTIEPYDAFISDGFVWGRGTNDMKGAVACMLTMLLAVRRSNAAFDGTIIVACVVGEEDESAGTERLVMSGLKADGAVVGEPSNYEYAIGHRGLEWLEVAFYGKASHGGIPEQGVNAIVKAAEFIMQTQNRIIPKIRERSNEFMGHSTMNIGTISGGTQPSTVADRCVVTIDRRYVVGESVEMLLAEYQEIIDDMRERDPSFTAEITRMPGSLMAHYDHTYHFTPFDDPIVMSVRSALRAHLGEEPQITRKRGWTDAATMSHYGGIPTVITGPGNISCSHTKDERVPIADLYNYVDIYANIAMDFLK